MLALGRFGLLAALAAVFGLVLHQARLPGGRPAAAALGGLIAGVLLGPMVLGAARPPLHAALFEGAQEQREALAELEASHRRELAVLRESDVSAEAVRERMEGQRVERKPLEEDLDEAIARFQMPARRVGSFWIAGCLLAGGLAVRRPRRHALLAQAAGGADESDVLGVAVASVLTAALLTALLAIWLLDLGRGPAVAVGAATAAGSAFSRTPTRWIARDGRTASAMSFGGVSLFVAVAVFAIAVERDQSIWLLTPLVGYFAGSMTSGVGRIGRRLRRVARGLLLWIGLPTLAAAVVAQVDPRAIFAGWGTGGYVVLAFLLSGVGHWIGAAAAGRAIGRGPMHDRPTAWWLETHARGVPMTQLCFAAALLAARLVDPTTPEGGAVLLGLVLGVIEFELSLPMTRRTLAMAMRLEEVA